MIRSCLAAALVLSLPVMAAAQEDSTETAEPAPRLFFDFEAGDVFEYERVDYVVRRIPTEYREGTPQNALHAGIETDLQGYERWTVLNRAATDTSWTTVFRVERLRPDRSPDGEAECVVEERFVPEWMDIEHRYASRSGECSWPGLTDEWALLDTPINLRKEPLLVGDEVIEVDTLSANAVRTDSGGFLDASGAWVVSPDVGLALVTWFDRPDGGRALRLVHAEVGGRTYGSGSAPEEAAPDPATGLPSAFALEAAYPNPFRASLTLRVALPSTEAIDLEVYDALGRFIQRHALGEHAAGWHDLRLDGRALASGVYVVRVRAASGEAATYRVTRVR